MSIHSGTSGDVSKVGNGGAEPPAGLDDGTVHAGEDEGLARAWSVVRMGGVCPYMLVLPHSILIKNLSSQLVGAHW